MSMKMVSAAKYARAEKDLKAARPLGEAASVFYDQAEVSCNKETPKNLYVAITSDRGLAGGVHSSICKAIKADLHEMTPEAADNTKVICFGNKSKSVVSYDTTAIPIFSQETVMGAEKITAYDSVDADVVQSYLEFSLASLIYYAMKEGACSEQSSRMTAMD